MSFPRKWEWQLSFCVYYSKGKAIDGVNTPRNPLLIEGPGAILFGTVFEKWSSGINNRVVFLRRSREKEWWVSGGNALEKWRRTSPLRGEWRYYPLYRYCCFCSLDFSFSICSMSSSRVAQPWKYRHIISKVRLVGLRPVHNRISRLAIKAQ